MFESSLNDSSSDFGFKLLSLSSLGAVVTVVLVALN